MVFLTGYSVAMATNPVQKVIITCSSMIRHLFDTIIVVPTEKGWYSCSIDEPSKYMYMYKSRKVLGTSASL